MYFNTIFLKREEEEDEGGEGGGGATEIMFGPQILNYLLLRNWPFPRRLLTPKLAPGSILLSPPNVGLRYYCVHSEPQHAVSDSLWTVPHKSALLD